MKYITPEISWHSRDPLYSVDLQPGKQTIRRLATCGTDRLVRLWMVKLPNEGDSCDTKVEFLSTLSRHSRTVNVVRFSHDGTLLASGADDSAVILWKLSDLPPAAASILQEDEEENREVWTAVKVLRSHLEDVYDISWSADGKMLISGSVDNTAILWDVRKGQKLWMFTEHKSFVQGVAFDPLNVYLATVSDDRSLRIFSAESRQLMFDVRKLPDSSGKSCRMFHSADTMKSFFRRLSFSPDGQLLVVPAGCLENSHSPDNGISNATYVFCRSDLSRPVLCLTGTTKPTLVVRFCPLLFQLRDIPSAVAAETKVDKIVGEADTVQHKTLFNLPYRMIYATASENAVLLYDTQQSHPFAYLANLHYHTLSDLTWSHDGRLLIISSTDGYCSLVTFDVNELGIPYEFQNQLREMQPSEPAVEELKQPTELGFQEVNESEMPESVPQETDLNLVLELSCDTLNIVADNSPPPRRVSTILVAPCSTVSESDKVCETQKMPPPPPQQPDKRPRRVQLMTISTN